MAKSETQIRMDFEKARRHAERLEQAARDLKNESARFGNCRSEVASAWQGDNASKFTGKMGIVVSDLDRVARELERSADTVRRIARNVYEAEMEAKRKAEMKTI